MKQISLETFQFKALLISTLLFTSTVNSRSLINLNKSLKKVPLSGRVSGYKLLLIGLIGRPLGPPPPGCKASLKSLLASISKTKRKKIF